MVSSNCLVAYAGALSLCTAEVAFFLLSPALSPSHAFRLGDRNIGSTMFVRRSYKELWKIINAWHAKRVQMVGLLGNPGVGKTMSGAYFMRQAKAMKRQVIYQQTNWPVFHLGWDNAGNPHVWAAPTVKAFFKQLMDPKIMYIVDGRQPEILYPSGAFAVLITSPDPEVHGKHLHPPNKTLYMDIWSRTEMDALRKRCFSELRDDDYASLLSRYGCIPRWALLNTHDPKHLWYSKIEEALGKINVVSALLSTGGKAADRSLSHLVVHMRASADHLSSYYTTASDYVAQKLVQRAAKASELEFFWMLKSLRDVAGWEHVYGQLFQFFALYCLVDAAEGSYQCQRLPKGQGGTMTLKPQALVEFKQLDTETFDQCNTLYTQHISEGAKLAAADAVLTPSQPEDPAYLIQVTAGRREALLSQSGMSAVQAALGGMFKRQSAFCEARGDTDGQAAWQTKSNVPLIIYLVPDDTYPTFAADLTQVEGQAAPRFKVSFTMTEAKMHELINRPAKRLRAS